MEMKQLTPDEFSDARKAAMQEIYGENWKETVLKQQEKINDIVEVAKGKTIAKKSEYKRFVADVIVEMVDIFEEDLRKLKISLTSPLSAAYGIVKKREKESGDDETEATSN